MFDKWVNQDSSTVLAWRNRVVVGAEVSILDLLRKVVKPTFKAATQEPSMLR